MIIQCEPEVETHYEDLRFAALHPDSSNTIIGMGLFILRGMIGWIEALPTIVKHITHNLELSCQVHQSSSEKRSELVKIIANIILSSWRCVNGG